MARISMAAARSLSVSPSEILLSISGVTQDISHITQNQFCQEILNFILFLQNKLLYILIIKSDFLFNSRSPFRMSGWQAFRYLLWKYGGCLEYAFHEKYYLYYFPLSFSLSLSFKEPHSLTHSLFLTKITIIYVDSIYPSHSKISNRTHDSPNDITPLCFILYH